MTGAEPADTIGYWGVVVPHLDEFQGFYLRANKDIDAMALQMQFAAVGSGVNAIGTLQAAIIEGFTTGRQDILGVAARALYGIVKHKHLIITGTRQAGGTTTEMFVMKATTIDEARDELNAHPLVVALKERLATKVRKKKH